MLRNDHRESIVRNVRVLLINRTESLIEGELSDGNEEAKEKIDSIVSSDCHWPLIKSEQRSERERGRGEFESSLVIDSSVVLR